MTKTWFSWDTDNTLSLFSSYLTDDSCSVFCWVFLWILRLILSLLFSLILSLTDFIWSHGFEYRTCCDFQIYNCRLSLAHRAANSCIQLSVWYRYLKLNQAKQYSWWQATLTLPFQSLFIFSLPHLGKWYLHLPGYSRQNPLLWSLSVLLPHIQFTTMSCWFYFQNISQLYDSLHFHCYPSPSLCLLS